MVEARDVSSVNCAWVGVARGPGGAGSGGMASYQCGFGSTTNLVCLENLGREILGVGNELSLESLSLPLVVFGIFPFPGRVFVFVCPLGVTTTLFVRASEPLSCLRPSKNEETSPTKLG